ncbi:MAG: OmpA family protein [Bacteroidetes bacterium]|nr:OmpA family protein [Bacteroidota bacterium]
MKFITEIIFSVLLLSSISFSQGKVQRYNPFSGTIVFSVEGGVTLTSTDYAGLGVDYLGRASLEYFFPSSVQSGFGLRLFGSTGFIKGDDASMDPPSFRTSVSTLGGGVVFILSIGDDAFPYFFAGVSNLSYDPKGEGGEPLLNNAAGKYNTNEINYNVELGVRFPVTPNLSLNVSGGVQISPNDWLDDKAIGTTNDLFFTVLGGISYSFLTEFDSDGDGVIDTDDACPNTPRGIRVNEFGCPIDMDNDGVPDYQDNCPGTPKNVKVDVAGCPIDTDNDGVPDYTDICPNTPRGIAVDELGCPYDLDVDGIPDYMDKCPDTPYSVDVDNYGCPLDSDLDGVPDYLDQCPGTLPGMQVDEQGCEITPKVPEPVIEEPETLDAFILSAGASFAFNSADLKPEAYPVLDNLLKEMKKYPMSRWKIEGYTDNIGSEGGNLRISQKRAEAVANYFISRGIPKGRFVIKGLGSKNPIADNRTEEGREKNRRVAITKLN